MWSPSELLKTAVATVTSWGEMRAGVYMTRTLLLVISVMIGQIQVRHFCLRSRSMIGHSGSMGVDVQLNLLLTGSCPIPIYL
jgi:hypothetical protein